MFRRKGFSGSMLAAERLRQALADTQPLVLALRSNRGSKPTGLSEWRYFL